MYPEAIQWLLNRRSIRSFHSDPVADETIELILQAAMAAPSANNKKPWHFLTITDRAVLNRIAEVHPFAKMCREAPLVIVVCAEPDQSPNYWEQDCAAATENILLAGTSLGLGTVWLGVHPRLERKRDLQRLFDLPATIEILSMVAIGRPAEVKEPRTQYDPARVHRENW
ncbi:MAG: nitroreductase family protein [Candidatus Neomarinimicrobiota bacterium]